MPKLHKLFYSDFLLIVVVFVCLFVCLFVCFSDVLEDQFEQTIHITVSTLPPGEPVNEASGVQRSQ